MSKLDKIEELQQFIKQDPTDFQTRRKLAVLLMDCGFNEEALQHLLYLSKNFSFDDGIFYNLGIVYEKLKKFEKAKESYLRAIELEPEAMDSVYNLGLVYTELKEFDNAINCFEKILKEDSDDSNTYFNLGLVYFKQKNYIQAIENFQKTIDLNDSDLYAHFYIGNIYKEFGDLDAAKMEFNKVIELSPDYSWAYFNLAVIFMEENDFESSVYNLQKTIEMNPFDIEAYKILVKILMKKEKFEQAQDVIGLAITHCEDSGDINYLAAIVYKKIQNMELAKTYFDKALKNHQTLSISLKKAKDEFNKIK